MSLILVRLQRSIKKPFRGLSTLTTQALMFHTWRNRAPKGSSRFCFRVFPVVVGPWASHLSALSSVSYKMNAFAEIGLPW